MIERLSFLWPEAVLFVTTCVVMVLGLSRSSFYRNATPWVAGAGLLLSAAMAWTTTPHAGDGVSRGTGQVLLPNLPMYVKVVSALVGLLLLLLQAGTVDRVEEEAIDRGERRYDPLRANRAEYYAFYLFSLTGLMLCASAHDLIWLFLALELTSLPTYIMVTISTSRNQSREAGVKYFFLGALGAAIFLFGFALIYGGTGTTRLNEISDFVHLHGVNSVLLAGVLMSLVGLAFKIAAAPMHFYTPDVYQGAAPQVSAFLAFVPKTAGFVAILLIVSAIGWRFLPAQAGPSLQEVLSGGSVMPDALGTRLPESVRLLLWVMAALTMTVGNVLALLQTSVKRILAYSSIAHSGYMLVGVIVGPGDGSFTRSGVGAVLFYLMAYGVMNAGTFAVLACLERTPRADGEPREVDHIDDLRGLTSFHPILGWTMTLCSLSLLGLPPLLGFFSKLPLFTSGIHAGEYILVVVLGVNSAIAAYYYLRLAFVPFLEKRDEFVEPMELAPFASRRIAAMVSALSVVVLAIGASGLMRSATWGARAGATALSPEHGSREHVHTSDQAGITREEVASTR